MKTLNECTIARSVALMTALVFTPRLHAMNDSSLSDEKSWFSLTGKGYVAYQHDSNVGISELDTNSNSADSARYTKGNLKLSIAPTDAWVSDLSVTHSATSYGEQSEFDLDITTLGVASSYAFEALKVGVHYYDANASLGSDRFLSYEQYGVSAGKLIMQRGYVRLSTDKVAKQFETATNRNSNADSFRADMFWFFEDDDFVELALTYQDEDAVDNVFSFKSNGLELGYSYPVSVLSKVLTFKLAYQLNNRNYANETAGGIGREDDSQRIKLDINYEVLSYLDVVFSARSGDFDSTLAQADYNETIAEIGVNLHF
ncbi:DUF560 domain-containing protein [Alteromonas genovensis]|uniref:DUF560 domain-containing protein n=1 Tax=Alteromonas genovensis TaxID=471225 RepID=A0A6N9THA4_9ALTE|nr:surface lipoprotein assembly modifier [Alteromonas genovensis]NDW15296.1 DUF560 domain-containing protein [Alteromonas genovensis]